MHGAIAPCEYTFCVISALNKSAEVRAYTIYIA